MSPEELSYIGILTSTVGGCVIAYINYRDRLDQRRALDKAHAENKPELVAQLNAQTAPTKLPASGAMVLLLFACSMSALTVLGGPDQRLEAKAGPRNKQCTSAADCDRNERCERGLCVANAKSPSAPRSQNMSEADADWALHVLPRAEQLDPYAPMSRADDVIWARTHVGRL